ncbi:MAG: DNA primase [Hyphomicrobiaceae bacterium]
MIRNRGGLMRLTPQFLDEIRTRLPVSQVVARKVALKKQGREFRGLSPFKSEKTPSFFVNDQKGFYHCFASGEHGDIFSFVMKTEGLSFPEAVERLAGEAGLALPKPTYQDHHEVERADERVRLHQVLEASAAWFEARLKAPEGQEARRYIERRGLRRETIAEFRLGFAPAGRSALKEHLGSQGFTPAEMATSGMLISGEDIPVPYDRFRNRVMFPITDLKGRVIAFGGRALDPDAPAKYLNSPETPLFHKGGVLFNAVRARQAAHERGRIIAVEGYMDVLALHEAGFGEAVAPLGTALTETQVQLLWRMSAEPILCFDGDSAGRKAAFRAVDTAIPLIKPGTSVAFAFLPDGVDPDDLIRQQGREAMASVLERSRPLADILWEREWASGQWTTPERRAQLERQLAGLIGRIGDAGVRAHYERDIRGRLFSAWTRAGGSRPGAFRNGAHGSQRRPNPAGSRFNAQSGGRQGKSWDRGQPAGAHVQPASSDSLRSSRLVAGATQAPYREALLLQAIVNHPWLIDEHSELIGSLTLTSKPLSELRDALLSLHVEHNFLDRSQVQTHLTDQGLAKILALVERAITHKGDKFAEPEADRAAVETGWRHVLALHEKQVGLRRALDSAEQVWLAEGSQDALTRICELQEQLNRGDGVDVAGESRTDGEVSRWSA